MNASLENKRRSMAIGKIAKELKNLIIELDKDPLGNAYILLEADDRIRELILTNLKDIPEAVFIQFFYCNLRHHLWAHITNEASLRVSDETTCRIMCKIKTGLNSLAVALEKGDKLLIYDALVELTYGYIAELNKGGTLIDSRI